MKEQRNRTEVSLAGLLGDKINQPLQQKLSLGSKGISIIGQPIIEKYRNIKALYLPRNNLSDLNGIEQFVNLRSFSAAENYLADFVSVSPLSAMSTLEAVSLEGNPLTHLPNYRSRVINLLPGTLQQLDGKPVSQQDREAAVSVCAVEDLVLSLAVSTARLIQSLKRAISISELHKELCDKVFVCNDPSEDEEQVSSEARRNAATDIARLAVLWTLESTLDDAERQSLQSSIQKQVVKAHSGTATWHTAYSRLLANQAQSLEELACLVAAVAAAGSTPEAAVDSGTIEPWTRVCLSLRETLQEIAQLNPKEVASPQQAQQLRHRVLDLHTELLHELSKIKCGNANADWVISAVGNKEVGLAAKAPFGLSSPRKDGKGAQQPQTSLAAQHTLALEENAKLRFALQDVEHLANDLQNRVVVAEETAAAAQKSKAKVEKSLRCEQTASAQAIAAMQGWLDAAKASAEEARKESRALQSELENARASHAAEVAQLMTSAACLREELEDAETIKNAMWNAAETNEGVMMELRQQVQQLSLQKEALYNKALAAEEAARIAVQPIMLELNVFFADELEEERGRSAALAYQLEQEQAKNAALMAELETERQRQKEEEAAAEQRASSTQALKVRLQALEDEGLGRRARRLAVFGLRAWRRAAQRAKQMAIMEERRKITQKAAVLQNWKRYAHAALLLRCLESAAGTAASMSLLRKAFGTWRRAAASMKQVELADGSPIMQAAALKRRHRVLKSAFGGWRDTAEAEAAAIESSLLLCTAQQEAQLLAQAFTSWKVALYSRKEEEADERRGNAAQKLLLLRKVLASWRHNAQRSMALAVVEAGAVATWRRSLLARVFVAWVQYKSIAVAEEAALQAELQLQALEAAQLEAIRETALAVAEDRALRKARNEILELKMSTFTAWRASSASTRHNNALLQWSGSNYRRRILRNIMHKWRLAILTERCVELALQIGQLQASLQAAEAEVASGDRTLLSLDEERSEVVAYAERLAQELNAAQTELGAAERRVSELEKSLEEAIEQRIAAERLAGKAIAAAEVAADSEGQFKVAAEQACHAAEEEKRLAAAAVESANAEVVAAKEACMAAQQQAQAAEIARSEAEMVAIEALENAEAASAAFERLSEECRGLQISLRSAEKQISALDEKHKSAAAEAEALKAATEALRSQEAQLNLQIASIQKQWRQAEEDKAVAESDAQVAFRQAQRLADIMEQHAAMSGHRQQARAENGSSQRSIAY